VRSAKIALEGKGSPPGAGGLAGRVWDGLVVAAGLLRRLLGAAIPLLQPADVVLEVEPEAQAPLTTRLQPPPIPAAARRRTPETKGKMTDQEMAWQELMSGRHPRLIARAFSRPTDSTGLRV
jgi:hypothetical protein